MLPVSVIVSALQLELEAEEWIALKEISEDFGFDDDFERYMKQMLFIKPDGVDTATYLRSTMISQLRAIANGLRKRNANLRTALAKANNAAA